MRPVFSRLGNLTQPDPAGCPIENLYNYDQGKGMDKIKAKKYKRVLRVLSELRKIKSRRDGRKTFFFYLIFGE